MVHIFLMEELMNENRDAFQELRIINRNNLQLNCVNRIVSFDSKEFIVETNLGPIHIYGDNLELGSLDTINGNIIINGNFNGFDYLDMKIKKTEESIWEKLFK